MQWQPAPIFPTYRPLGELFPDTAKGAAFDAYAQAYVERSAAARNATGAGLPKPGQSAAIVSGCGDPGGGLYSAQNLPTGPPPSGGDRDRAAARRWRRRLPFKSLLRALSSSFW